MIVEKDLDGQKVPVPLTVLLDHDVIDGAPMPRFLSNLSENIEKGIGL
ncbi:MAG: hypothetical protein PHR38_06980 [Bacteroidales bacterium]|nr:hypothetical protein [Bacteroidales bacterium]MDD4713357.1 hypothetical protein [Bacteroidales bacterium]